MSALADVSMVEAPTSEITEEVSPYGSHAKFVRPFNREVPNDTTPIPLACFHKNVRRAMKQIGLGHVWIDLYAMSMYECPYMDRPYYSAVPVFLFTKNAKPYLEYAKIALTGHPGEMFLDREWMLSQYWPRIQNGRAEPNTFVGLDLGSGYTPELLADDGDRLPKQFEIALSNGDSLLAWCWVWYGK